MSRKSRIAIHSCRTQIVAERLARFRQINMEQASVHHDALEFSHGKIILLVRLCAGQHATVLQLPASSPTHERSRSAEAQFSR